MFITFEGIEGVGKSTQVKALKGFLEAKGCEVVLLREPGGTLLSENIRDILLSPETGNIDPVSELLLYSAARAELLSSVIEPALKAGKVVILDRYTDSTLAYQGYGRGLDLDFIETLNNKASHGIDPDVTFLIDLPVEEGLKRAFANATAEGRKGPDRLEGESQDFHERVREGFLKIAKNNRERVKILDGTQEIPVITHAICDIIEKLGI